GITSAPMIRIAIVARATRPRLDRLILKRNDISYSELYGVESLPRSRVPLIRRLSAICWLPLQNLHKGITRRASRRRYNRDEGQSLFFVEDRPGTTMEHIDQT